MGDKSKIEWTEATWNPVTGCSKVSIGCKNCYAERLFPRTYGKDKVTRPDKTGWGVERPRKFTDIKLHHDRLDQPLSWKKPRKIFVNSMSDLFHEEAPFEFIDKVFAVMAVAGNHVFQVLTKRPEIMLEYTTQLRDGKRRLGDALVVMNIDSYIKRLCIASAYGANDKNGYDPPYQPFKNVWLGVSVENQQTANERIPLLLQCPAAVRFLSCEPLLGEIDFKLIPPLHDPECACRPDFMCASIPGRWCAICGHAASQHYEDGFNCCCASCPDHEWEEGPRDIGVDWVICGGESGPNFREMKPEWARSIRDQCQVSGIPFFFKQWSGIRPKEKGRLLDGQEWNEYPKELVY